jgi:dolichyl-phosphate-mannose-protein mannosyltransferase
MLPAKSLRAPLLWTTYVLLPAAGWGFFHGVPAGLAGAAVLFVIWWIWWLRGTLPVNRALVVLVLVKLLAGVYVVGERGLEGEYFANAEWTRPIERGTDFPSRSFTRIDRQIAFGGTDRPDFPLYFFNDSERFNFYNWGEPDRAKLPFSVTWQGYVSAPRAEDRRQFYLRGNGVTAELWVDGAQAVHLDPTAEAAFEWARWPAGLRQLTVRVSVPDGASRQFEAGFVDAEGKQTPFDDTNLIARPYPGWRVTAGRIVRFVSRMIDVLLIALLLGIFASTVARIVLTASARGPGRRDAIVALVWIAAMAGGLLFAGPAVNRLVILGGGSDELTYESYARDILLNGPLMLLGHPAGQASAFYYQPLYPYFLALTHAVLGEDLSGVYLAQWLLASVTVLLIWKISIRLFGRRIGNAALALGVFYFAGKLVPMAGQLLNEDLFMPLVALWTLSMIRMATPESTVADTIWGGISGGLAVLARSTLLASWVVTLPLLALARRRAGKSQHAILGMVAIMIAIISIATVRNWIVSRTFVPIASSFGVNLYLGNQPPTGLVIRPGSDYVSMVAQFAQSAPRLFIQNLAHKALYALGFFDAYLPRASPAPGLIATWFAALIGLGVLMWHQVTGGVRGPIRAVPFAISASNFLVVTLIFPAERLIIPLYVLLLPYAALGIMWTVDFIAPPEAE